MTTSPSRIVSLDLARGVAILGTLATNIWIFTNPEGLVGFMSGRPVGVPDWGWQIETWLTALVNGKFLGLLTLMFGIGVAIQHTSAVRRGAPWPGRYRWRALLLFVDAVIHYFLVTEFDILMGYAVTGLVLAYILLGTPRLLAWVVAVSAVLHAVLLGAVVWLVATGPSPAVAGTLNPNPYAGGSFMGLVAFRFANLLTFRIEPVFITFYSLAMFGAGAMLYRRGLFAAAGARLRRILIGVGAPALVLDIALNVFGDDWGFFLARYSLAGVAAMGLLAAIAEYGVHQPLGRAVVNVGRMALSCYVGTNVLASATCYGWGLGLAASIDPAWRVPFTLALALAITLVLMGGSTLWLRRWQRGPLEAAWAWSVDVLAGRAAPVPAAPGRN